MKRSLLLIVLAAATLVATACSRSHAADGTTPPETPAAIFKAGYGLQLSPAAAALVDLQTADAALRPFPGGEVTAVPRDGLLRTVHGDFVFVVNGDWLLRTPVKTGAIHEDWIEIVDGLYDGDRVAVRGVRALWLAELQAVNGGVGCADGH